MAEDIYTEGMVHCRYISRAYVMASSRITTYSEHSLCPIISLSPFGYHRLSAKY